jgi:ABC-type spermidine/putrescine transport system permease subunit II
MEEKGQMKLSRSTVIKVIVVAFVLVLGVVPAFAQSVSLNVQTDDFINSINLWLPLAIAVVVIGVGITSAFNLAEYIGDMFNRAFRGGRR